MNPQLQDVLDRIKVNKNIAEEERNDLVTVLKEVNRTLSITEFKLERTEKVKKTTAILLEETIEELEQKRKAVEEFNEALKKSLEELKATQSQLIQAEKMASLGELTAGIAHEIQNPLNFVNNFSEVNTELIQEISEEIRNGNYEEVKAIAKDILENEKKIVYHGKRADAIVKNMLQHSRSGTGEVAPTDINALADEYLRLAYHGFRAKDKTFNVAMKTDFDPNLEKLNIVPQDIGRVILNLITNAFYAVTDTSTGSATGSEKPPYAPTVSISTRKAGDRVEMRVKDNGSGIPQDVIDKIFQPFFSTKPTGEGTGLGLSMSYDIVKAHRGSIKVQSMPGEGSVFIVELPLTNSTSR